MNEEADQVGDEDLILAAAEPINDSPAKDEGGPEPPASWIQWYLTLDDHDFFVEVDRAFLEDPLNLVKLKEACMLPKKRVKEALKLIGSARVPSEEDL